VLDVDALLHALTKPSVVLGGQKYEWTYPTFRERLEIDAIWHATDFTDADGQRRLVAFVADKTGLPADALLDLPEAILTEAMNYFLETARGLHADTTLEITPSSEPSAVSA